jgi:hypothetical protein
MIQVDIRHYAMEVECFYVSGVVQPSAKTELKLACGPHFACYLCLCGGLITH